MRQTITSPDKFATMFNSTVPETYRHITAQDIRDMTECGLIRRYGYYIRLDLEMVMAILKYEKLREKRLQKPPVEDRLEPPRCKRCRQPLPPQPEGKIGRPREYCTDCEPARSKERYRKLRSKKQAVLIKNI